MTLPANIRINLMAPFPSLVQGSGPIGVTKQNGVWTVSFSVASFGIQNPPPVGNLATDNALVYDSVAKQFIQVPLSSIGAGLFVDPRNYGAKLDGVTDDSAAFQAAINAGVTLAREVIFFGQAKINTGLSINGPLTLRGVGFSSVLLPAASINAITINTASPVFLHDFAISYSPAANVNIAAITVNAPISSENANSRFVNLLISNAYFGFNFIRASTWVILNSIINQFGGVGAIVSNVNNVDSGDSAIFGSTFIGASGAGQAIVYNSSGGLRFENNKINGTNLTFGFFLNLASGAVSADLFIIGNSIEGIAASGAAIAATRIGTTGSFSNVVISGNELTGLNGVSVPTDANGAWLNDLVITGNVCNTGASNSSVIFAIDSTVGLIIADNHMLSNATGIAAFSIGSAVTHCTIGPNSKRGSFGSDSIAPAACDNIALPSGILSNSPSGGIGYATGAGGTVTQITNRSTGVTLNKTSGAITLVSAAGSATPATFTLTNNAIAATDIVLLSQKSGADKYEIFVTNVLGGSCQITFFTTGGTTTEQPVFSFVVIKGVAS